jgi:hypothetical protein
VEYLKKNLLIVKNRLRNDYDWLHINVGYERSSKSTLSLWQMLIVDDHPSVNRITFTASQFKRAVDHSKPYQVIIADEGAEAFFARDAVKSENMDNQKMLTKIGAKRLFIIINVPDLFLLDPYIRSHRILSLCRVVNRGRLAFYSKKRIPMIKKNAETKTTEYPEPNFYDDFPKLEGRPGKEGKLWKDYLKKKMEYLSSKTDMDKLAEKADRYVDTGVPISKAAKMMKVSYFRFSSWIRTGKVKLIKLPSGLRVVPKSEINRLITFFKKQTDNLEKEDEIE